MQSINELFEKINNPTTISIEIPKHYVSLETELFIILDKLRENKSIKEVVIGRGLDGKHFTYLATLFIKLLEHNQYIISLSISDTYINTMMPCPFLVRTAEKSEAGLERKFSLFTSLQSALRKNEAKEIEKAMQNFYLRELTSLSKSQRMVHLNNLLSLKHYLCSLNVTDNPAANNLIKENFDTVQGEKALLKIASFLAFEYRDVKLMEKSLQQMYVHLHLIPDFVRTYILTMIPEFFDKRDYEKVIRLSILLISEGSDEIKLHLFNALKSHFALDIKKIEIPLGDFTLLLEMLLTENPHLIPVYQLMSPDEDEQSICHKLAQLLIFDSETCSSGKQQIQSAIDEYRIASANPSSNFGYLRHGSTGLTRATELQNKILKCTTMKSLNQTLDDFFKKNYPQHQHSLYTLVLQAVGKDKDSIWHDLYEVKFPDTITTPNNH